MKNKHLWIGPAVLLAALFVAGCRDRAAVESPGEAKADEHSPAEASLLTLTPEAFDRAGLKTEPAAIRAIKRTVVAPGVLELNARRLAHLTSRTSGRIERVFAVRGDRVRAGQVLAELYSPAFLTLQAEFLMAAERMKRHSSDPAESGPSQAMFESARDRLLLLGASAAEIDSLAAALKPQPLLAVRAALTGTVLESDVVPGDHVEIGNSLFRIADLSVLWAGLRIQEKDLAKVISGADVSMRSQAYPGEIFRGRLILIGDVVDPQTRAVEGRVEVPNPRGRLKSGMYVEASFDGDGERQGLTVPEDAVQEDEGRMIVFVKTGERTFAARVVEVGERAPGYYEIVRGLAAGEEVAVSGAFLLKSELKKNSMEDDHGHD